MARFNQDDPKKLSYFVNSDEELIELLRATFEVELWTAGQDLNGGDDIYFECEPKLFTVYHTGQLKRIFCNTYTFAESVNDWQKMVECFLKIIKVLTGGTAAARKDEVGADPPEAKRQKINAD